MYIILYYCLSVYVIILFSSLLFILLLIKKSSRLSYLNKCDSYHFYIVSYMSCPIISSLYNNYLIYIFLLSLFLYTRSRHLTPYMTRRFLKLFAYTMFQRTKFFCYPSSVLLMVHCFIYNYTPYQRFLNIN